MELLSSTLHELCSLLFWSGLYVVAAKFGKKNPEWRFRAVTLLYASVATAIGLAECGPFSVTACNFSGSFLFWSGLYVYTAVKSGKNNPEWCSRAITLLHGCVSTVAGLTQCGPFSLTECSFTAKLMARHYALMVWSWGYFAFDLLWCIMYWPENLLMLLHHVTALGSITVYMWKENSGLIFPCSLAILEITNPLLQLRWFLRYEGYDKTILFKAIEVIYLMTFITLRGVVGTYLMFKIISSDIFDLEAKTITLLLYFVSLGLIYEIIGFVIYKYRNKIEEFRGFLEELGHVLNLEI